MPPKPEIKVPVGPIVPPKVPEMEKPVAKPGEMEKPVVVPIKLPEELPVIEKPGPKIEPAKPITDGAFNNLTVNGDFIIRDKNSKDVIRYNREKNWLVLGNKNNRAQIAVMDNDIIRTMILGATRPLSILDKNGKSRFQVDGDGAETVILRDEYNNPSMTLGSSTRDLFIKDTQGAIRCWMKGGTGSLVLQDENGIPSVTLGGGPLEMKRNLIVWDKIAKHRFWVNGDSGDVIFGDENGACHLQIQGSTGNIIADGDIYLRGADCAEKFELAENDRPEPGSVLVIGTDGKFCQCTKSYDKKVAGVISGANGLKPGLILNGKDGENCSSPISLSGKVYCKVDTAYGPVEVGDLLTTSPTCGHAMKAADRDKSFGAIIGKALRELTEGRGLIPILVALQ